jgi:N-carbamoylputrescine amidase
MDEVKKVKVGFVQMECVPDKEKNLKKAENYILEAVYKGARIICLQELFHMVYFCYEENYEYFRLAEMRHSITFQKLSTVAKENKAVLIIPYFEKRAEGIYHNSAMVIDADGSIAGNYRKIHIPDDPGYYEKFYFTPGDSGYMTFKTRYATIGVLICWDQWYPEAARITTLKGAQILFYPTAIGWEDYEDSIYRKSQKEAWICINRSHAIANGNYVVAVNRVGREKLTTFWGNSFISDPMGNILCRASQNDEQVLVHELDLGLIDRIRTQWPFFRDRRVDTYQTIGKKWID